MPARSRWVQQAQPPGEGPAGRAGTASIGGRGLMCLLAWILACSSRGQHLAGLLLLGMHPQK